MQQNKGVIMNYCRNDFSCMAKLAHKQQPRSHSESKWNGDGRYQCTSSLWPDFCKLRAFLYVTLHQLMHYVESRGTADARFCFVLPENPFLNRNGRKYHVVSRDYLLPSHCSGSFRRSSAFGLTVLHFVHL